MVRHMGIKVAVLPSLDGNAGIESCREVCGCGRRLAADGGTECGHCCLEAFRIDCWVCECTGVGWLHKFPWHSKGAAIHHLSRSAFAILLDCRPDAEQDPRQGFCPPMLRRVALECRFQLSVKSFDQPVGLRMIRSCPQVVCAECHHELFPEVRCELATSVSGNGGRGTEPGDPS